MAAYGADKTKGVYFYQSPVKGVVDKRCPTAFIVLRFAKSFDPLFYGYHTIAYFQPFHAYLNEKRYTVRDTRTSYRTMNSWSKQGLLPEGVRRRSNWKKFSVVELVWIDAIHQMRKFGMSLEDIAKVRDWVMQWDKKHQNYPWLEYYLSLALMSDDDPMIVVLPGGAAELASPADIEITKAAAERSSHMLLLSLKTLLVDGFEVDVPRTNPLRRISPEELRVIKEVRDPNNKEVRVRTRDGIAKETETKQSRLDFKKTKIGDLMRQFKASAAYGEIVVHYEDGEAQAAEVIKRRRFTK